MCVVGRGRSIIVRKVGMKEEKREGEGSCVCGQHLLNWLLNALQYAGPYGHFLCFSYGTVYDKRRKEHVITRERKC